MRLLFLTISTLLFSVPAFAETGSNPLIGTWRVDTVATADYLKKNRILPEAAVDRVMPVTAKMRWRFDDHFIYSPESPSSPPVPYRIVARASDRLIVVAYYPDRQLTSVIELGPNCYWQSNDTVVKGYRERVVRADE